jgi:hypothetical protein
MDEKECASRKGAKLAKGLQENDRKAITAKSAKYAKVRHLVFSSANNSASKDRF